LLCCLASHGRTIVVPLGRLGATTSTNLCASSRIAAMMSDRLECMLTRPLGCFAATPLGQPRCMCCCSEAGCFTRRVACSATQRHFCQYSCSELICSSGHPAGRETKSMRTQDFAASVCLRPVQHHSASGCCTTRIILPQATRQLHASDTPLFPQQLCKMSTLLLQASTTRPCRFELWHYSDHAVSNLLPFRMMLPRVDASLDRPPLEQLTVRPLRQCSGAAIWLLQRSDASTMQSIGVMPRCSSYKLPGFSAYSDIWLLSFPAPGLAPRHYWPHGHSAI
jgi:hypothetical protein